MSGWQFESGSLNVFDSVSDLMTMFAKEFALLTETKSWFERQFGSETLLLFDSLSSSGISSEFATSIASAMEFGIEFEMC